ncbi:MAG: ABC transporter ATP-binding protein [Gammaproteobacteria bacterium]
MSAKEGLYIRAAGVTHAYGERTVLDGIDLRIDDGEVVGIIGPNGAGKSTLLRIFASLIQPSGGRVETNGRVTSIMTLGLGLYEDLSGRENVLIDCEFQGRPRDTWDATVDAIREFADLGEFFDMPIKSYSTGMKSRLNFAMLTHVDPEILIIDEALSAGDYVFATRAYQRLRALCARGAIVIIVTHSMGTVVDLCRRCVWIDGGRIRADGTPAEVTSAYLQETRRSDEERMLADYRHLLNSDSQREGFVLDPLRLLSGPGGEEGNVLTVGEAARILIGGRTGVAEANLALRLRFERLDGLRVIDSTWPAGSDGGIAPSAPFTFEAVLDPFILGVGRYLVIAEILADALPAACVTTLVQVEARSVPSGGQPALLSSFQIEILQDG